MREFKSEILYFVSKSFKFCAHILGTGWAYWKESVENMYVGKKGRRRTCTTEKIGLARAGRRRHGGWELEELNGHSCEG